MFTLSDICFSWNMLQIIDPVETEKIFMEVVSKPVWAEPKWQYHALKFSPWLDMADATGPLLRAHQKF